MKTTTTKTADARLIQLELPVRDRSASAIDTRHIELQLDPRQARGLAHVFAGLVERHTRLRNGRYVQSAADVARWLFEQVAEAARE